MGFREFFESVLPAPVMTAPPPKASFSVDIPPELSEVFTQDGAVDPRISRAIALQVPAVLRARNLIAGTIGSLPLTTIGPDKLEIEGTYLLGGNIDPDIPNTVMLAYTAEDMLFEGIAWWRVTGRDWHGYPVTASHVPVDSVHVAPTAELPSKSQISADQLVSAGGQVFIDGYPVPDAEIIRFDSPNPPLLRHAARAIRTCLKLDRAAALYSDAPQPLAVFTPKEGVDPGTEDEIEAMLDRYELARLRRATGYVGAALNLDTLGWSPEQMQLVDARQHAVLEIARAAGVDPEDLGVSTTSRTYQNAETRRRDLLDFTLGAYISAMQDRLSMRDVLPSGHQAKIKLGGFLRSDTKMRYEAHAIGLESGFLTLNEVREMEDRPPLARRSAPQPQPEPEMEATMPAATFSRDSELPEHWEFAVDTPDWGSIGEADYTPEQWRRACLIDTGEGDPDSKSRYKLPVKTPSGALHRGGVHAAAAALAGARGDLQASSEQKSRAARALVRLYGELDEEPPESIRRMAGMSAESEHPTLSFDDPEAYASFRVNEERRTISGLVVPWGKVAVSRGQRWRFAENSLRWADASRVKLNMGHDRMQTIGAAIHPLRITSEGLDVTFRVANVPEGDRALALAASKAWDGLSIEIDFEDEFGDDWEADPKDRTTRLVRQAKLMGVALTPMPAFDDARVAAVAASKDHTERNTNGNEGQRQQDRAGRAGTPRVRVRSRQVHRRAR